MRNFEPKERVFFQDRPRPTSPRKPFDETFFFVGMSCGVRGGMFTKVSTLGLAPIQTKVLEVDRRLYTV